MGTGCSTVATGSRAVTTVALGAASSLARVFGGKATKMSSSAVIDLLEALGLAEVSQVSARGPIVGGSSTSVLAGQTFPGVAESADFAVVHTSFSGMTLGGCLVLFVSFESSRSSPAVVLGGSFGTTLTASIAASLVSEVAVQFQMMLGSSGMAVGSAVVGCFLGVVATGFSVVGGGGSVMTGSGAELCGSALQLLASGS